MEDRGSEIPGVLLTAEPERKWPSPSYWTGAALSFGFWSLLLMVLAEQSTPILGRFGLFLLALVFGMTSWVGVGAALAVIVLTLIDGFGI